LAAHGLGQVEQPVFELAVQVGKQRGGLVQSGAKPCTRREGRQVLD
jgi:hypothetical protein